MRWLFRFLLGGFGMLVPFNEYAQGVGLCDVHRQQFSILKDGTGVALGAELLVGEYPSNALSGLLENANKDFTAAPEYLIVRQIQSLSKGDVAAALADFEQGESRENARQWFANTNDLKRFYTNFNDFVFRSKAIFGPITCITYQSAMRQGHRVTLSACLRKKAEGYVLIAPPNEMGLFSWSFASFPYWETKEEREIPQAESSKLLNATFRHGAGHDTNDDSTVVIKYHLTDFPESKQVFERDGLLWTFLREMVTAYRTSDTNGILSLWETGSQKFVNAEIKNNELQSTVNYFKSFNDFNIQFYITSSNQFWLYISPVGETGQLKLIRLVNANNEFKLTTRFSEVFADKILSSEEMATVLVQQAKRNLR